MHITASPRPPEVAPSASHVSSTRRATLRSWVSTWELYPILIITLALRLYHIDSATFIDDDAVVFHLARDFFTHGLLPITSNLSSLGSINPPMVVYLFMIPAAFSGNPLWGEVMVGLLNSAAVLLTYFFTRRYYGRFAGTTAALLFATAAKALLYSRNIWPQNLLPFFVLLFLFALFRGVVERRKGWLVPAVALLCVMYQLHGTGLFMLAPLLVAVVFGFRTLRWHDIVLSALVAVVLFAPYLYYESLVHWADIRLILSASKNGQPQTGLEAINDYYNHFLSPYVHSLDVNDHYTSWPTYSRSIMVSGIFRHFQLPAMAEMDAILVLLGCSIAFAVARVLLPERDTIASAGELSLIGRWWRVALSWWQGLYASPRRMGIVLLLAWQATVLSQIRHTIVLYPHYFIIFLPGQFILIALFLGWMLRLVRQYRPDYTQLVRVGISALVVLLTLIQLLGSTAAALDSARGTFDPTGYWPGFSDLGTVQAALARADQLAQERHISRIYIPVSYTIANPVRYLAEQMKTPVTTFDAPDCTLLPDPHAGPVVFLDDSRNTMVESLIGQYAHVTRVAQLPHLANPPFNLDILTANPEPTTLPTSFTKDLQLLDPQAHVVNAGPGQQPGTSQSVVVTRWRIQHAAGPEPLMVNNMNFQVQPRETWEPPDGLYCGMTRPWAGDQLLFYPEPLAMGQIPPTISVQAAVFTTGPAIYHLGPLNLATYQMVDTPWQILQTPTGQKQVTLPVVQ